MRTLMLCGLVAILLGLFSGTAVARFDGSVPLLCAPATVFECGRSGECARQASATAELPAFLTVDVNKRVVGALDKAGRTSPIRNVERTDGQLVVQGGQNGRGWSLIVSEETGAMSATVSGSDFGFVIFGACTPLPGSAPR